MRKDCDRPPDKYPENGSLFGVLCLGGGPSCGAGDRGNADLLSFGSSGKFVKLLRSDP